MIRITVRSLFAIAAVWLTGCATMPAATEPFVTELETADQRTLSVRVLPATQPCQPCDVIVFSHGFNLSYDQYDALLPVWADSGYIVVAPLHVDSEAHPRKAEYGPEQTLLPRLQDWVAIVEALVNQDSQLLGNHRFSGRYLAAGHSYGALIAQFAGGARDDAGDSMFATLTARPTGIIALSPPGPVPGYFSANGWSHIDRPHLLVTGTADVLPGIAPKWQDHLVAYEATKPSLAYALVYDDMDHYFGGAFGRETETISESSRSAIKALNRAVLKFANAAGAGRTIDAQRWQTHAGPAVKAMTQK